MNIIHLCAVWLLGCPSETEMLRVLFVFAYCTSRQCEILINLFLVFAIMRNIFPRATLGSCLVQGCEDCAFDLLKRLIFFHAKCLLLKQYAMP